MLAICTLLMSASNTSPLGPFKGSFTVAALIGLGHGWYGICRCDMLGHT
jgi:hypothetical protein